MTEFVTKVRQLNEELGPLSQKMATVKAGFSSINTAARSASVGVATLDNSVNTTTLNLSTMIVTIQGVVAALQPLIRLFSASIDAASEWDGIRYQFGNAFGEQADEYYEKITRITDALMINKQAFMENSAMATSMLIGFGVDRTDAREMGLGYTELAYDIWAAFNNVYKSLDGADGAMAAVRSAISGEVEPIRRAGFTIVDSQLAITAANHGLAYSTTQATEAQKSYLRYLTLVDQAQKKGIVGTYAREMQTAEGMMRTFSQQVKSLAQAFGSLFLPILVKVMPYLQAFVELLTEAVHWIAGLFGIEIQDISQTWNDYSSGVSDAVENTEDVTGALNDATDAAKALKNASIGIDELNVISPPSATSGGGAGGAGAGGGAGDGFSGLDINSLWDEAIFDTVQTKVDEIKKKLKGMFDDWLPVIKTIGAALGAWTIASLLGQLGNALSLGDSFLGLVKNIKKLAATAITIALQFKLMKDAFGDFMGDDGTILDYIEGILIGAASTYLLRTMWGVGGLTIGLGVTAVVSLSAVIEEGGITDVESAVVALTGLAAAIGAVATGVKALSGAWAAVKTSGFVVGIIEFFQAAKFHAADVGWLAALFPKLSTAIAGIPAAFSSALPVLASAAPYVAIAAAVVGGITLALVDYDFTGIGRTIGESIGKSLRATGKWIVDIGKALFDGIAAAFEWFADALDIETVWDVLKILFVPGEVWRRIEPEVSKLFDIARKWIEDKIENLKGNINEFFGGFFDGLFDGLGLDTSWIDRFVSIFDIDYLDVVEAVNKLMNPFKIGQEIINGIIDGLKSGDLFGTVKSKFTSFVDKVKEFFGIKSQSTLMRDEIGKYLIPGITAGMSLTGIRDRLSSAFATAKTWWDKKPAMKTYTPSIGSIQEKLRERFQSALTWWKSKKPSMSYTPSIGSIYEKLNERYQNARTWWNSKKPKLSYTPSIGSITDKLKSAWNSAKSWWNKNVKLSTKLNVQVPTIKVKWETASAFGKSFKYPTGFSLKFAANGGIFDQGSLIWAGERGPEVMATAAGGKTGVMNVQQMQDAVYEGVYAAMSAAMRGMGGNGTQTVKVYLDGKEITSTVEQHQHERGASIMGNGVYAY
jgi:ABC-type transporter Mla subunit MlaD